MSYPFTTTATYPIRTNAPETAVLEMVATTLRERGVEEIRIQSGLIEFSVPWYRSLGPLASVDRGTIRICQAPDRRYFKYELSHRRAWTQALVADAWFVGIATFVPGSSLPFALACGTAFLVLIAPVGFALYTWWFERIFRSTR